MECHKGFAGLLIWMKMKMDEISLVKGYEGILVVIWMKMKMVEISLAKCRLDDSDSIHPEGAFASFIFRQQTSFYPKEITTSHDVGPPKR